MAAGWRRLDTKPRLAAQLLLVDWSLDQRILGLLARYILQRRVGRACLYV